MLLHILIWGIMIMILPIILWVMIILLKNPRRVKHSSNSNEIRTMWQYDESEYYPDSCSSADREKEVKKEVALHECEKMLFPPENELTESPYSQRVMKMTEREFTADDADVIKDIEYLRYIQEQEQIDAELEAQREEDEEMTA